MLRFLLASAGLLAMAGQAHAFSYFSVGAVTGPSHGDPGHSLGQTTVVTFDNGAASGILPAAGVATAIAPGVTETITGDVGLYTGNAFVGGSQVAAAPAGDTSQYEAIGAGGEAIFNFTGYEETHQVNSLSVYLGSVDAYNTIIFLNRSGGTIATITGAQLPASNGDQGAATTNRRAYFTFAPSDQFASVAFLSSSNAFEYDTIAVGPARFDTMLNGATPLFTPAPTSAVPEPSAWAAMLIGFSLVGIALRRRAIAATI